MTTLAVTFYDVIVWLHVTSVVIAFGPTFAFGIYLAMTARDHPRSIPAVIEAQGVVTRTMVTIGGVLILLTGLYLVLDSPTSGFSDFFVGWGIVAILVLLGLAHGFFLPHDRRALAAAKRDIEAAGPGEVEFGEEFNRESGASARMGPIAGLIVILTIYVMVAKPFL
ncbi:MAG: DUF2269 family protein [Solirubrobacterales bacterium]